MMSANAMKSIAKFGFNTKIQTTKEKFCNFCPIHKTKIYHTCSKQDTKALSTQHSALSLCTAHQA